MEGHSGTRVVAGLVHSGDALSGVLYDIPIPSGCSVRELREAVRCTTVAREASAHGQDVDGGAADVAERFELLCIDESSDDAPVVLEDGRWLSHYTLPHEEKKIFAYRLGSISGSSTTRVHRAQSHAMGVGSDLRELLHSSTAALGRSSSLHVSARTSCESSVPEHMPALVRDLVVLSCAMQEKDTRVESRLSLARTQVQAMSRYTAL